VTATAMAQVTEKAGQTYNFLRTATVTRQVRITMEALVREVVKVVVVTLLRAFNIKLESKK